MPICLGNPTKNKYLADWAPYCRLQTQLSNGTRKDWYNLQPKCKKQTGSSRPCKPGFWRLKPNYLRRFVTMNGDFSSPKVTSTAVNPVPDQQNTSRSILHVQPPRHRRHLCLPDQTEPTSRVETSPPLFRLGVRAHHRWLQTFMDSPLGKRPATTTTGRILQLLFPKDSCLKLIQEEEEELLEMGVLVQEDVVRAAVRPTVAVVAAHLRVAAVAAVEDMDLRMAPVLHSNTGSTTASGKNIRTHPLSNPQIGSSHQRSRTI